MKTQGLLIPLVLSLGIFLALAPLWLSAVQTEPAGAALVTERGRTLTAPAAELHVCPPGPPTCDYASIQEAVDAAGSGDIIKVATGTYSDIHYRDGVTQVVYISKTVAIEGGYTTTEWGNPDPVANPTTLDAQGQGRVVYIDGTVVPLLDGLEITGGDATGLGGGPWPYAGVGGGIYVVSATAIIANCNIHDNVAGRSDWNGGGGVYLWDSPSTVIDNTFLSNIASTDAEGEGGGIALSGSDALVQGNTFQGNIACDGCPWGIGGAVYIEGSRAAFRDNVMRNNTASNAGWGGGGGIWFGLEDRSVLTNTVLIGNSPGTTADATGAAIASEWSYPRFVHTTIHDNSGGDNSGVSVFAGGAITMVNTILVSQTVGITVTSTDAAVLDGVLWYANGANYGGDGIITVTNAITGDPKFLLDGYHIISGSTAMDNGVNSGDTTDIDGQVRPYLAGYDIGADEWWPCVGLTDVTISGPITGSPGVSYNFTAVLMPPGASPPFTYTWAPEPNSGQGASTASYTWPTTGTYVISVTAGNCGGTVFATHTIDISGAPPPVCDPLTVVSIAGPTSGFIGFPYDFGAVIQPPTATLPITYTWAPEPDYGQGTSATTYSWATSGTQIINVIAENCGGRVSDEHFIAIQEKITASVEPTVTVTLVYTDPQGMTTTIEIPDGAVTQTTVIAFIPVFSPTQPVSPGLLFANHAFDMDAYRGSLIPGFIFAEPVIINIRYSDADVTSIVEDSLRLYYWDGSGWVDAATTCSPPSSYTRDLVQNVLSVPICHLSHWGMQGLPIVFDVHIHLPLVLRNTH